MASNPLFVGYGPFQLRRWRNLCNGIAVVYTFFTSIFLFFPIYNDPSAITMNWSIVLVGGMFVFSIFWWFVKGRKTFVGPDVTAMMDTSAHLAE